MAYGFEQTYVFSERTQAPEESQREDNTASQAHENGGIKEDIERSREMFEKRIPVDIRTGHNYFHDELVRILADGDADALGM